MPVNNQPLKLCEPRYTEDTALMVKLIVHMHKQPVWINILAAGEFSTSESKEMTKVSDAIVKA